MTYAIAALLVVAGIAGILYGGWDDSPGLQGLGLLIVVGAVVLAIRTIRRGRAPAGPE